MLAFKYSRFWRLKVPHPQGASKPRCSRYDGPSPSKVQERDCEFSIEHPLIISKSVETSTKIRQQPAKVCQQDVISFHLEGSPFGPCHNDMLQQGLPSCGWTNLLCSGTGAAKPLHHCWTRASRLWSCRSPRCRPEPPETQRKSGMDLPSSRYIDTVHLMKPWDTFSSTLCRHSIDDVYTESTLSCQSYHRALRMPQAKVVCILSHAVNVVADFTFQREKPRVP